MDTVGAWSAIALHALAELIASVSVSITESQHGVRGTIENDGNTDVAIFRRDTTLYTVFIIHPNRLTPLTSLQAIASVLDKQVQ